MKNEVLGSTVRWIQNDWNSNRKRFMFELTAWVLSVGCSITMAATVPDPPLFQMYIFWISGCAIYAACAWSRQSFGMFANYLFLCGIDMVGLTRMVIA